MTHPTGHSYYVRTRGRVQGPLTADKIKLLRARGQFGRASEVSLDGYTWSQASAFKELFEQPARPAKPEATPVETPPQAATTNSNDGVPASVWQDPPPASRMPVVLVSSLIGLFLIAATLVTVVTVQSNRAGARIASSTSPSTKPSSQHVPRGSAIGRIRDAASAADLDEVVGLVVCGWRVELSDGTHKELSNSTGTCFCVNNEGHLLTNRHVVETTAKEQRSNAARTALERDLNPEQFKWNVEDVVPCVWVFFAKKKWSAEIIHVSDDFDMAILKIDRVAAKYFELCSDSGAERLSEVVALGYPGAAEKISTLSEAERQAQLIGKYQFALDPTTNVKVEKFLSDHAYDYTLTSGVISRPPVEIDEVFWIQHNADISPGNSGGPLTLANDGRVVGINTLGINADVAQGIFLSVSMPQLREEIDAHVPGVVWK